MKRILKTSFIIFYNSQKQLLLQERWHYSKLWEEWAFFWWWIEQWEHHIEAFYREAKEELNIDMNDFTYQYIWEQISEYNDRITYRYIYIIKTNLKESDFTVLEWTWAKFFDIKDINQLKFINPVEPILDKIKRHL